VTYAPSPLQYGEPTPRRFSVETLPMSVRYAGAYAGAAVALGAIALGAPVAVLGVACVAASTTLLLLP